jgi:hypothetical protein
MSVLLLAVGMEKPEEEFAGCLEREVAECQFQDVRHGKRFRTLFGQLAEQIYGSIPFACQDWGGNEGCFRHSLIDAFEQLQKLC